MAIFHPRRAINRRALSALGLASLAVAAWPLGRSIWFSLTDTNINNISEYSYVGFDNYFSEYGLFGTSMFSREFWETDWGVSIKNTFQFSIVSVVLETLAPAERLAFVLHDMFGLPFDQMRTSEKALPS